MTIQRERERLEQKRENTVQNIINFNREQTIKNCLKWCLSDKIDEADDTFSGSEFHRSKALGMNEA